ncbi:MAG: spore germination protein [Thermanaeromonas sp.]|uniref:GerAB/ArcD/ProY family transporter n=1 Tax=Thermanaeromonas sp. TaxID=2003697 RepID=UPI00244038C6|nr:endospore germination permease [Thermanaeromonas sp.]MCG0277988.1 spore germination protein [Thermanaeromonas sp.]
MRGIREEGFIHARQAAILMWFNVLPTAIIFLPSFLAKTAQQDAWLAVVVATVLTLPLGFVLTWLGTRFPHLTLFQYSEIILGRILGKIISTLYVLALILLNALVLREFSEFLVSAVMPETPLLVFTVTLAAVAVYGARNGIEVISRSAEFVMPLMVLFILTILSLVTPEMSWRNLFPVLERGVGPVLAGAIIVLGFTGEISLLAGISGFINPPQGIRMSVTIGLLGVFFFLVMVVLGGVLVFGSAETARLTFVVFSLARMVSIANFLERIEVLFMAIWVAGVFIKVMFNLYIASIGVATVMELTDFRPLCAPLAAFMVALSVLLFKNISHLLFYLEEIMPVWTLLWAFGMPIFLAVVAALRKPKGERVNVR